MNLANTRVAPRAYVALLSALVTVLGPSFAGARQPWRSASVTEPEFSLASLSGLYAYANIADDTRAGYGMLEFDGFGNVRTDGITLNVPGNAGRQLFHLGAGVGVYTVDPDGQGTVDLWFEFPDSADRKFYAYEFVVTRATRDSSRGIVRATELFAASETTGVANSSVTYVSPLQAGHPSAAMQFGAASLEGDYAYANNADVAASYGVLNFDGNGKVETSGIAVNVPDPENPGQRGINRIGRGYGDYAIDAKGQGKFNLYFEQLDRSYTYEFVVTGAMRDPSRRVLLATDVFSAITATGLANQLVAPVLTRVLDPKVSDRGQ